MPWSAVLFSLSFVHVKYSILKTKEEELKRRKMLVGIN
jgi:hypothetical protein